MIASETLVGYDDDPNLPEPESKKKKSLWERLGTWGSPDLLDGMNHTVRWLLLDCKHCL